jgi:hypothetical protein
MIIQQNNVNKNAITAVLGALRKYAVIEVCGFNIKWSNISSANRIIKINTYNLLRNA